MAVLTLVVCFLLVGGLEVSAQAASQQGNSTTACPCIKCPKVLPRTCKDVRARGSNRTVVKLYNGMEAMCDTESDGGGWLVIQRRSNGHVDFYRNWFDYKYGFGDVYGNFWLGNEKIHRLTFLRQYQLRVDITYDGIKYFAKYSNFRIFGEAENYQLEVSGYSGNAGDSLTYHNKMAFSTMDRDNDLSHTQNCARRFLGAWWYNDCQDSSLNGRWLSRDYGGGLCWSTTTGRCDTAETSEMKIKIMS